MRPRLLLATGLLAGALLFLVALAATLVLELPGSPGQGTGTGGGTGDGTGPQLGNTDPGPPGSGGPTSRLDLDLCPYRWPVLGAGAALAVAGAVLLARGSQSAGGGLVAVGVLLALLGALLALACGLHYRIDAEGTLTPGQPTPAGGGGGGGGGGSGTGAGSGDSSRPVVPPTLGLWLLLALALAAIFVAVLVRLARRGRLAPPSDAAGEETAVAADPLRRAREEAATLPEGPARDVVAAYVRALGALARGGEFRRAHETAREFAARLEGDSADPLRDLTRLYERARHGGEPMPDEEVERADALATEIDRRIPRGGAPG